MNSGRPGTNISEGAVAFYQPKSAVPATYSDNRSEIPDEQLNIAKNFRENTLSKTKKSQSKPSEYKKEKKSSDFPKVGDTINIKKNSFKVVNSDNLRGRVIMCIIDKKE